MSSESTPVLCGTVASFELLMTKWERLGEEHPELKYWTWIGLFWAEKYYKQMDDTNAYIVAMGKYLCFRITQLLNHTLKFSILPYACRGSYVSGIQSSLRDPRRSCMTS
jgi:hypothetical protein